MKPTCIVNWRDESILKNILTDTPLDWSSIFQNDHPADLEIGIGNGSFLVPFVRDHAGRNMVGIEIESFYARKADKNLVKNNLTNGRVLIGDAKLLTWKLFAPRSIDNVYINFPDPWFKKRHKKRRMVNPLTLSMLASKMRSILTIATDDEEYRDWVIECIEETQCFGKVYPDYFINTLEGYYPTKYEKKWRAQGKNIFYMKFQKIAEPNLNIDEYILTQNLRFVLDKIASKIAL